MNRFSASDAALEGFRLTRERPGMVLAWAGINALGMFLISLLMLASLDRRLLNMATQGRITPDQAEVVGDLLAKSLPTFIVVLVLVTALTSVLVGGILRSILRPEERSWAGLRLGADELRLTVVNLLLYPIGLVCFVSSVLAYSIVRETASPVAMAMLVLVVALTAWLGARLSLVTPMTFATRKIAVGQAWIVTRGRFWPILGMMVLAAIFYIMILILISIIGFAIIMISGGSDAAEGQFSAGALVAAITTLVMQVLISVLQLVMIYSPFAIAYQQIVAQPASQP